VFAGGAVHARCHNAAQLAVRRRHVPRRPDDARRQRSRVDVDVDRDRRRPLLRHRSPVPTSHEDPRLLARHCRRLADVTVHLAAPRYLPEG